MLKDASTPRGLATRTGVLCVVLSWLSLCSMALAQNAIAITSANVSGTLKQVTVGVTLAVDDDLRLLNLQIAYDKECLEITPAQVVADASHFVSGNAGSTLVMAADGTIKWTAGAPMGDLVVARGSGPLLSLTFTVRDGCPTGLTPLAWVTVEAIGTDLDDVPLQTRLDGAINVGSSHTVTFLAGPHGTLTGSSSQTVAHDDDSTAVTAVADQEYVFDRWTLDGADYSTTDSLTVPHVIQDMTLTALFRAAVPAGPYGAFVLSVPAAAFADGAGFWDLTGHYSTSLGADPLALALQHDTSGRITGTATLQLNAGKTAVPVPLTVKGNARGSGGAVALTLTLKGANAARRVGVSLSLNLTLDAATRQLSGPATGSIKTGTVTALVDTRVELELPAPTNGTWTLQFSLVPRGRGIGGTAFLRLSTGKNLLLSVAGRAVAGGLVDLTLSGHPSYPAASGIKIRTTITPLDGGWARIKTFSQRGFGQALQW